MKKYTYSEIEKIGYHPFIKLMVKELNDNNIKHRNNSEFYFDEDNPEVTFLGSIVDSIYALEFLKKIGLVDNGICPMCGRRPIDGKYTFTDGQNKNIKFNICKGCFTVGSQNSLNPNNKEGCFIATLCYGGYNSKEVIVFRSYRDTVLKKSFIGRILINIYYQISPKVVHLIRNHVGVIHFIKSCFLNKFYSRLDKKLNK